MASTGEAARLHRPSLAPWHVCRLGTLAAQEPLSNSREREDGGLQSWPLKDDGHL